MHIIEKFGIAESKNFGTLCRVPYKLHSANFKYTRQMFWFAVCLMQHTANKTATPFHNGCHTFTVCPTYGTRQTQGLCRVHHNCREFFWWAHGKCNLRRVLRLCRELFCTHTVNVPFAVCPINGSRQTIWHTANVLFPVVKHAANY